MTSTVFVRILICCSAVLQGSDLLLGAPGLRTWTGGFVDIRQTTAYFTEYMHKTTEDSEMMGERVSECVSEGQ